MLGFGKVTCAFCSTRVSRRSARRTQIDRSEYVCEGCYARWDAGHADCGGGSASRLTSAVPAPKLSTCRTAASAASAIAAWPSAVGWIAPP